MRHYKRFGSGTVIVVAALLTFSLGKNDAQAAPLSELVPLGGASVIKAEDLIQVDTSDLTGPGTSATFIRRIHAEGTIGLPFIEKLQAKGRTCGELEAAINKAYRDARVMENLQVKVQIVQRADH